jgi:hypothetical protein
VNDGRWVPRGYCHFADCNCAATPERARGLLHFLNLLCVVSGRDVACMRLFMHKLHATLSIKICRQLLSYRTVCADRGMLIHRSTALLQSPSSTLASRHVARVARLFVPSISSQPGATKRCIQSCRMLGVDAGACRLLTHGGTSTSLHEHLTITNHAGLLPRWRQPITSTLFWVAARPLATSLVR